MATVTAKAASTSKRTAKTAAASKRSAKTASTPNRSAKTAAGSSRTAKTTPTGKRTSPARTRKRSDAPAEPAAPEQRAAAGKAARATTPLEAHAEFQPASQRDPVALLLSQAKTRVPDLVPIRHGRMLASPFAFYRGAALVMAADLKQTPTSGLRTQLAGMPPLQLRAYLPDTVTTLMRRPCPSCSPRASTEHSRLPPSLHTYRTAMRDFAAQTILTVWYQHLEIEQAIADYKATLTAGKSKERKARFKATEAALAKAHTRDSLQAIGKLTAVVDGKRQIINNPPLVIRGENMTDTDPDVLFGRLRALLASYSKTLESDRRYLLDHFTLTDIAQKVVGVGSVGTRAWILLLESGFRKGPCCCRPRRLDLRPLQATQANRSTATKGSASLPVST